MASAQSVSLLRPGDLHLGGMPFAGGGLRAARQPSRRWLGPLCDEIVGRRAVASLLAAEV